MTHPSIPDEAEQAAREPNDAELAAEFIMMADSDPRNGPAYCDYERGLFRLAAQRLEARGTGTGAKIIKALQDAEAGGFSCVLVNGCRWWREGVKDQDSLEARGEISEAIKEVLEASDEFREGMGPEWKGDPLTDACDRLRAALSGKEE